MKKKNCLACINIGKNSVGECRDALYIAGDEAVSLPLCYPHSVELFKYGQKLFVVKYSLEDFETFYESKNSNESSSVPFFFNSFR